MSVRSAGFAILVLPVAMQIATAVLLVVRRLYRDYLVFFAYLLFAVLRSMVLYRVMAHYGYFHYFYLFWFTEPIIHGFMLVILYQCFRAAFEPFRALRQVTTVIYLGVTAAMLGMAILAVHPGAGVSELTTPLFLLERSLTMLRAGLLLFLFAASFYLGIPLRKLLFGIALGFGCEACLILGAGALRSYFGPAMNTLYSLVASGAQNVATLIWLIYAATDDPVPVSPVIDPVQLRGWSDSLQELLRQ